MTKQELLGKVVVNIAFNNFSAGTTYLVCEYSYPDQPGAENWVNLLDIDDMIYYTHEVVELQPKSEKYFVIDGLYRERLIAALQNKPIDSWPRSR